MNYIPTHAWCIEVLFKWSYFYFIQSLSTEKDLNSKVFHIHTHTNTQGNQLQIK